MICNQQYVGQTETVSTFSTECSSRRGPLNEPDSRDDSDQMFLSGLCSLLHGITNEPPVYETCCFCRTNKFSLCGHLLTCEDKFCNKQKDKLMFKA